MNLCVTLVKSKVQGKLEQVFKIIKTKVIIIIKRIITKVTAKKSYSKIYHINKWVMLTIIKPKHKLEMTQNCKKLINFFLRKCKKKTKI